MMYGFSFHFSANFNEFMGAESGALFTYLFYSYNKCRNHLQRNNNVEIPNTMKTNSITSTERISQQ